TLWSSSIIEELIRQGADFFCISPGSRSTPLTVAIARNPKARWKMFADERSAAFFALGYGRATAKPAVLVCTSGTAVANYFPAVVEASMDFQPMLVLSADRPFELLECGANQTIRQENIFGSYTRWHMQLPAPSKDVPLKSVLSTIAHAVAKTLGASGGPVHLNQPFREPLEPETPDLKDPWVAELHEWLENGKPFSSSIVPEKAPDSNTISMLRQLLAAAEHPIIIAGSMTSRSDALAVSELSSDLNIPLYADFSSGLRMVASLHPWQLLLQSPEFRKSFKSDLVLHFGGNVIAKHPSTALKEWQPEHNIVIKPQPDRFSPDHNVTCRVEASITLCAEMLKGCRATPPKLDSNSVDHFFMRASEAIQTELIPDKPVTDISAARLVSELITGQQVLFVSNSMPVRDMDNYANSSHAGGIPTAINRGVSGIDGIISTAAGFANGDQKPGTLMIGDIAFLHDLNALSLLGTLPVPLQIIVLNNNGGAIFSFLPVSEYSDVFETHFATPQNYSIRSAAETFGLDYACPHTNREFSVVYQAACSSKRSIVIEVCGNRAENLFQHRALQARINTLATKYLFVS
ncbi:MAG: 2-succinyl-5-enolpyruvyl-6-hydroxy-3-cyclohexene-1-carboxylic-acid synthase, partial [Geobacteraceae bacterium]|nr:2-succinyl-5-enolpyruvyl-6-hydroxy-3-cyclohexene-1-carboxylic-acid synthase [Geobacteraceae bacterium]